KPAWLTRARGPTETGLDLTARRRLTPRIPKSTLPETAAPRGSATSSCVRGLTLVDRVMISGANSPLRVSASGVSVEGAEFDEVLFDANYPSLRSYMSGIIAVDPKGADDDDDIFTFSSKVLFPDTFDQPLLGQALIRRQSDTTLTVFSEAT